MDNFFLYFSKGDVILWDLFSDQQWTIEEEEAVMIFKKYLSHNEKDIFSLCEFLKKHDASIVDDRSRNTWGWDLLSWFFHYGSKLRYLENNNSHLLTDKDSTDKENIEWARFYIEGNKDVPEKAKNNYHYPPVDIPLSHFSCESELDDLFASRFTSRSFINSCMTKKVLEKLLFHCVRFRVADKVKTFYEENDLAVFGFYRSSPAGGAMQSTDVYVIVHNVKDMTPGVYLYNPVQHGLSLVSDDTVSSSEIKRLLMGQPFAENAAVNFCFVSRFYRLWVKYPDSRAYRMAYVDVGHLSENMFLYAQSLNQDVYVTGAFADDDFSKLLKLDENSAMLFFMAVGEGKHACFPVQYFL